MNDLINILIIFNYIFDELIIFPFFCCFVVLRRLHR